MIQFKQSRFVVYIKLELQPHLLTFSMISIFICLFRYTAISHYLSFRIPYRICLINVQCFQMQHLHFLHLEVFFLKFMIRLELSLLYIISNVGFQFCNISNFQKPFFSALLFLSQSHHRLSSHSVKKLLNCDFQANLFIFLIIQQFLKYFTML